ncbi:hypothetical protein PU02_0845 [Bartonella ancashensis]|uniref:Uncharacterized protein n=1 Tax=Bartonella ancashensis TaxID=1318743 RepID=A0A0M4LT01_9HYPH|nr:hypothetical protein PU02_0845 [Bartonella ancashensis]
MRWRKISVEGNNFIFLEHEENIFFKFFSEKKIVFVVCFICKIQNEAIQTV